MGHQVIYQVYTCDIQKDSGPMMCCFKHSAGFLIFNTLFTTKNSGCLSLQRNDAFPLGV